MQEAEEQGTTTLTEQIFQAMVAQAEDILVMMEQQLEIIITQVEAVHKPLEVQKVQEETQKVDLVMVEVERMVHQTTQQFLQVAVEASLEEEHLLIVHLVEEVDLLEILTLLTK